MARTRMTAGKIKQESVKKPSTFAYLVNVILSKQRGTNKITLALNGQDAKTLNVAPSDDAGRNVVAWQVDTSNVNETATQIEISFPIGTPFSYIIGPVEIDDSYGTGVDLVWKRVKRQGNVILGVNFYYTVTVYTKDAKGSTQTYIASLDDPMVIVN